MAKKKADPRVVATVVVIQSVVGTLTVRDVKSRSAEEIRGPKWLWYLWGGTNTLGSAVYWLFGRRR